MSHRVHLRKKMFDQIRRWEQSGMTLREFCRKFRVERSRFYYWLKIFREAPERERSAFLPIIVDEHDSQPKEDRIVVTGQAGMTAFFPKAATSIPLIRQLLQG
jgi:hypothetical protein